MTWREQIRRAGRTILRPVARAVRGDSVEQAEPEHQPDPTPARTGTIGDDVTVPPAVPAWGLLRSQVPPRVELLRGTSSFEMLRGSWGDVLRTSLVVAVVGTLALLGRDDIPLFWIVPITLLVGGGLRARSSYGARARIRQEHRAGYTVWRDKGPQYPQVDFWTGYVIRPAGAPELSKQQEAAELKRVREIGRYVARHAKTLGGPS